MPHQEPKRVPSSLTLGGFDANRFEPHNISFDLGSNQSPQVAINQLSVRSSPASGSGVRDPWNGEPHVLLNASQADLFVVDSSTPFLWLPPDVCQQFETALGLTYDDRLELYTFGSNNTQRQTLLDRNLSFHFQLADAPGSSKSIGLNLSYDAFDLQLSYPNRDFVKYKNATQFTPPLRYFPLRKAQNSTQYTIGRAFLQETYLKVDYERNNFSIYQAMFNSDPANNMWLQEINRPSNSTWKGPASLSTGLAGGAVAGIVVGGLVALISFSVIFWCCKRRRGPRGHGYVKEKDQPKKRGFPSSDTKFFRWLFGVPEREMPAEIGGSHRFALEAPEGRSFTELPTNKQHASTDTSGSEPTAVDMHLHGKAVNAIGHDPDKPVELPYRMSHRFYDDDMAGRATSRGIFDSAKPPTIRFEPASDRTPYHAMRPGRPLGRQDTADTQRTAGISSPSSSSDNSRVQGEGSSPVFIVSPVTPGTGTAEGQYSSLLSVARRAAWYVTNEDPDPNTGTNQTQQSEESGISGISPEDSVSQGEMSRRSTVSPIEESPSLPTVSTIQEGIEPDEQSDFGTNDSRRDTIVVRNSAQYQLPLPQSSLPLQLQLHSQPRPPASRTPRIMSTSNPYRALLSPIPPTPSPDLHPATGLGRVPTISSSNYDHDTLTTMTQTPAITQTPTMTRTPAMPQSEPQTHTTAQAQAQAQMQEPDAAVTRQIRNSLQQGFTFSFNFRESTAQALTRTPASTNGGASGWTNGGTNGTMGTEQSTYSPARWIEFWRTGRDPREPRRGRGGSESPSRSQSRSQSRRVSRYSYGRDGRGGGGYVPEYRAGGRSNRRSGLGG